MWHKIGKAIFFVTLWAAIVAYTIYCSILVRRHHREQVVERLAIEIVDSTASKQLINSQRVREMLFEQGIATINTPVGLVDTKAIKETICSHGFVDDVDIYASYSGTLHISINQRTPIMRLLVDGYNLYITADGFVFRAPEQSALYVPVVTGSYRPQFDPLFEGELSSVLSSLRAAAADSVAIIEKSAESIKARETYWKERRKAIRDSSVKRSVRKEWSVERSKMLKYADGHIRNCRRELKQIEAKQAAVLERLEGTEREFNDFLELIRFMESIGKDRFLSAEVVQTVASKSSDNSIWLSLIPRSGNHRIEMGWLENCKQKIERLKLFYDKVAVTAGWESYKTVNLNFTDQIVCTYNEE
ncbi:MAG: hypothetical protein IIW52_06230 [Alistipes sp.]|nr:hypothetical protein [Alistipes sp.]